MEMLIVAEYLDEVLNPLSVPQMQEICKNAGLDHLGNKNILRNRIRRHVVARQQHEQMLKTKFPGLPKDLAQKSFEINSLLEQFRVSNARSTVNLENPPLENDPNISAITSEPEITTNLPALNTTIQASSHPTTQTSNSPILEGDLGDFGQTISNGSQVDVVGSNQSTMGPGVTMAAPLLQNTTQSIQPQGLNVSAQNFIPQNFDFQANTQLRGGLNVTLANQPVEGRLQQNPELGNVAQGMGGNLSQQFPVANLAANFSQTNNSPQLQSNANFVDMFELFKQFCQFMQMNMQNRQTNTDPQLAIGSRKETTVPVAPGAPFYPWSYTMQNPNQEYPSMIREQNFSAPFLDSAIPMRTRQQPLVPQASQPVRYKVDIKRISHISQALERRKNFFSGRPGSDPHKFMAHLEESARFMGLSEDEIFCCLPVVLQHEALEWYRLEENGLQNFQQFKTRFLEHHKVPYFQDRLAEEARLRTQGKDESIQAYVTCLRLIFEQLRPKLPLDRQLDRAVQNLNPKYALQINRQEVNSFEDLLILGKQVEVKLHNISHYNEPPPPSQALLSNAAYYPSGQQNEPKTPKKPKDSPKKTHPQNTKGELAAVIDSKPKQGKSKGESGEQKQRKERVFVNSQAEPIQKSSPKTAPDVEYGVMPNPGECFKCRRQGHKMTDCTFRARFRLYCYGCGRANTIKPNCASCKKVKQENAERGQSQ